MTDEARFELHEALQAQIGRSPTVTLMEALPPVGWADVVTKHDLEELERRLDLRLESKLQKEINGLFLKLLFAMLGFQLSFGGIVLGIIRFA